MDAVTVERFAEIVRGTLLPGAGAPRSDRRVVVRHVATHSGRIRAGAAFFALRGASDGHKFVPAAARNGAAVAVIEPGRADVDALGGMPVVEVDSPLRALQDLATWWRRQLPSRVVAVVGSNGKTITKDCLVHILRYQGPVYGTPGSYNSQLGVPLALLDCPADAEVAVIEVAVSDPGEMARQAEMVAPDCVVLTNVGSRWRSRFADRRQQIDELLGIAAGAGPGGWLLLGQDDPELVGAAANLPLPTFVQGVSPELPRSGPPTYEPAATRFDVTFPAGPTAGVSVRTPSGAILADVQLAMSAAALVGVDPATILDALRDYTPTSTRMEIWRAPGGATLVRDVATPDPIAVTSAVRTARRLTRPGGRTTVVLAEPGAGGTWRGTSGDEDAEAVAVDLAKALVTNGADEVAAVASPAHRLTATVVEELGGPTTMRLFDSTAALRSHLVETLRLGDVCLVQSPSGRGIGDLSIALMDAMAPTRLHIDLSALADNVTTFRRIAGPTVRLVAMVKALAYGTDAISVSQCLQEAGVDYLGVSGADEGVALRAADIHLPILVMLATPAEIDKMVRHRLTPVLYSPEMVGAVAASPLDADRPLAVHVEVDTGMHRSGLDPEAATGALRRLAALDGVRVEGLMTHLASADDPGEDGYTRMQLERFEQVIGEARALGLDPITHAGATAGTLRVPAARYDMVRIGLGLYGIHPSPATAHEVDLEPVISLVSRIVHVVEVPEGERVGYGGTFTAPPGGSRVGLVPAGYHDCVPRAFSNVGYVLVAGTRCPIVGRVSMDSMSVDLTACPEAGVGSDVLIYGRQGDWTVPLEEVSAAIGTIPYEVMARVGPRVQRIFTRH